MQQNAFSISFLSLTRSDELQSSFMEEVEMKETNKLESFLASDLMDVIN